MALELSPKGPQLFKIVSPDDPALDKDHPDYDWDGYKKDCDLSKLILKKDSQPTVFICDFNLPAKIASKIKNAMVGGSDDDGKPKISLGDWQHTCVQYALKEIQQSALELKRDGNKRLLPDVMDQLERWGMIEEIFNHYLEKKIGSGRGDVKN